MEITTEQLKEKISKGEKLLIDFYGTFCGPCKIMKPWFESARQELEQSGSKVGLYMFNIDTDREFVVSEMGIRSVPTIKGFSNGQQVHTNTGVLRKEQIIELANTI